MLTPQKPAGNIASGKAKIMAAAKFIAMAMADFPPSSPDFALCAELSAKLAKHMGKGEDEAKSIMPAELMSVLMQNSPGAQPGAKPPGGAPPPAPTMQ